MRCRFIFFFSSRRRHTRSTRDWSSDVCSSDLVGRHLPDGNIEILGRDDFQVKVQGYRIELGEIEAALREHPAVEHAVVVAPRSGRGVSRLHGFVTGRDASTADTLMELTMTTTPGPSALLARTRDKALVVAVMPKALRGSFARKLQAQAHPRVGRLRAQQLARQPWRQDRAGRAGPGPLDRTGEPGQVRRGRPQPAGSHLGIDVPAAGDRRAADAVPAGACDRRCSEAARGHLVEDVRERIGRCWQQVVQLSRVRKGVAYVSWASTRLLSIPCSGPAPDTAWGMAPRR